MKALRNNTCLAKNSARYFALPLAVAVLTLVTAGQDRAQAQIKDIVTAAVPPEGSTGYLLTAAISKAVNEHTPIKRVVLQTFGGAAGWPARMQTGEVNFGSHCGFKLVEEAYYGHGPFEKMGRQKNVLNMVSGHGLPFAMSVTDSSIKTLEDLKGKSIFAFMAHADQRVATQVLAQSAGLKIGSTLRIIPVRSPQEAVQGMLTGRAQGFFFGLIPGLVEVQQARGLRPLPLPQATLDAIVKAEPVWGTTIVKAGAPPLKPEQDIPTIEIKCGLAAGAQTSPETVYAVTKTIFDHYAEWSKVHPLARQWTLARAVAVMNAPYHDGAIRYYREKGIWGAAQDAKQKELIAK